jgi:hypothetical protein
MLVLSYSGSTARLREHLRERHPQALPASTRHLPMDGESARHLVIAIASRGASLSQFDSDAWIPIICPERLRTSHHSGRRSEGHKCALVASSSMSGRTTMCTTLVALFLASLSTRHRLRRSYRSCPSRLCWILCSTRGFAKMTTSIFQNVVDVIVKMQNVGVGLHVHGTMVVAVGCFCCRLARIFS